MAHPTPPRPTRIRPARLAVAAVSLTALLAGACEDGRPSEAQGRWEPPERLSAPDAAEDATSPAVAMSANGSAIVRWLQERDGLVWASRRAVDGAWERPVQLGERVSQLFRRAPGREVAMDAAGNTVAVWTDSANAVWASRAATGSAWATPERLSGLRPARSAVVALAADGQGFAVWQTGTAGPDRETRIEARRLAGGRWEPAQPLEIAPAEEGGMPQISVGANGTAIAVWVELRAGSYRIWANRYRPGFGWETAQPISSDEGRMSALWPDVGVDATGGAVAVWTRFQELRQDVVGKRLDRDRGWGPPAALGPATDSAEFPCVAVDPAGNAMAVWSQSRDRSPAVVWAARFTPADGWAPAEQLQPASSRGAQAPCVALDARGDGIAAWHRFEEDGRVLVWAARFTSARGWSPPQAIATGPPASPPVGVGPVAVAVGPGGEGLVAWEQWDGAHLGIWASRLRR